MDRSRSLRAGVARDATREGELSEESPHTLTVTGDVRIALTVGAFQPSVGHNRGRTVARAAHKESIELSGLDAPAQMGVTEVEPRTRSPVAEQSGLDVLGDERALQQRIVHQVDLPGRQIVGGAEIGIELA